MEPLFGSFWVKGQRQRANCICFCRCFNQVCWLFLVFIQWMLMHCDHLAIKMHFIRFISGLPPWQWLHFVMCDRSCKSCVTETTKKRCKLFGPVLVWGKMEVKTELQVITSCHITWLQLYMQRFCFFVYFFFFVPWPKRLMFNRPSPAFDSPVFFHFFPPSPPVASVVALNYSHTGLACQGAYQQHFNSPAKHTNLTERGE